MDEAAIKRAAAQFVESDDAVLRVEQEQKAYFDRFGFEALPQKSHGVGRPAHLWEWAGRLYR